MQKIGVFDSGIGGLTVAKSLYEMGGFDELIYFGDLAHLPYGDKSEAAIQAYSVRISEFLVAKGCDTIVIACNSASASATELLKEYLDRRIRVINVIDPMVDFVVKNFPGADVGIIGTKRTIQSGIYQKKILQGDESIKVHAMATPLLVPVIEENLFSKDLRKKIIEEYLMKAEFNNISALILGCTHYPIIKDEISEILGNGVQILDSSEIIGGYMHPYLIDDKSKIASAQFYASDITDFFRDAANRFMGYQIDIKVHYLMNIF
ncbi:MAG: glutamate racemase [Cyclobacteriaceae bacterium]|nr:glutamate racemase [Cyclobacteriaceae bacterium]